MNKKSFFSLLFICLLNTALNAEDASIEKNETITVVVVSKNPPFSFQLPNGSITGLYVEFWQQWSDTTNIPVKFIITSFEDGLKLMANNNTLHAGMFRNDERRQWADFSLAIHRANSGVIYNEKFSKKTKLSDLKGFTIATQSSSFHETYLKKQFPDIKLKLYDGLDRGVEMLLRNETDALFSELPKIRTELAKQGLNGVFIETDELPVFLHTD